MARFERGAEFVEIWVEQPPERIDPATGTLVHQWPELRSRSGRIGQSAEAITLERRHAWSARNDYARFQRQHLIDGWHRVRDPDREPELPDDPRDPALEAALRANPGDVETALVYADWLQQRDHWRGDLIAVQAARRADPDDPKLADAEQRLFADHLPEVFGPLWSHVEHDSASFQLEWELGFIKRAKLVGKQHDGESEDLLWELLRHPSARFLRALDIGCHHSGDQDNELVCALLVRGGVAPPLRALQIADFDESRIDNIDISRAPIGDLTGLGRVYPELEDVVLKGTGDVVLGDLHLPNAKRFALRTSSLRRATLAAILGAPWPALRDLELWFGDPDRGYGADCELADAVQIFACALPELRTLRIMNAMFSDEIVPAIFAWPGAAQLEVLDFSLGTLSDRGADALIAGRAKLPNLTRLGVFECALSAGALERLAAAGLHPDTSPISPAQSWREPIQKPARYVSVSE